MSRPPLSGRYVDDQDTLVPVGWRDSFLIERGKTRVTHGLPGVTWNSVDPDAISHLTDTASKQDLIQFECQNPRFQGDCVMGQKWKCSFDGSRWRRQKCRSARTGFWNDTTCVCDVGELKRDLKRMIRSTNEDFPEVDASDVEGIVWDSIAETSTTTSPLFPGLEDKWCRFEMGQVKCSGVDGGSDDEDDDDGDDGDDGVVVPSESSSSWRREKESVDTKIRELKRQLEQLREIRKKLKESRKNFTPPSIEEEEEENSVHGTEISTSTKAPEKCECEKKSQKQLNKERKKEVEAAETRARHRMKQWKKDRKRKKQRKKTENCNLEKVNCFSHDNDHWQTPPLWTDGPMCACINSNNNTYWCLRTINATHNLLYCQVITGLIMFFDLSIDPFQLRNIAHSLTDTEADFFDSQLTILRRCSGAKDCTVRSSWEHRPKALAAKKQGADAYENGGTGDEAEEPGSNEESEQLLPSDGGDNWWPRKRARG
ncbi:unnamed protein product [Notodromas monacha]|uniref:Extracellular sulfatase C-terminal domain-containing protein n=1 Tax=Notodromas monacha TaxID=399045 RepID=A0A7R9G9L5_9CRUS|nr:unnamed protein product [Notodromas monacha]CAG0914347.1 unnamed protein product [Notodromas monacha]